MDYLTTNRSAWDKRTLIHLSSDFYDVTGFIEGKNSLREIELAELGDVRGQKLLHLQCHFGLDTLSLGRAGAIVTGVDLSPVAVAKANDIKNQIGVEAQFICADVYDFGKTVHPEYDLVFTSYGTICWLPDLDQWAQTIVRSLKPNGVFYMADFHPVHDLVSGYAYFHASTPDVEEQGTYTENCHGEKSTLMTWSHPISEILNALIKAGIRIDCFNEYPFSPFNCFDDLEEREPDRFYLTQSGIDLPLVYTIQGTKTA